MPAAAGATHPAAPPAIWATRAANAPGFPKATDRTRSASPFPATKTTAIGIYYVVERDHHPFAHGRLEYSLTAAAFVTPPESATLARQAQAYVESYLRRKKEC